MRKLRNPYVLASLASLNGLLHGIDQASVSALMAGDAYQAYFKHPSAWSQSAITAILPAGSFFGALASGPLADRLGRRAVIRLLCMVWCIGVAIQASAQSVAQLMIGRAIAGVAIGVGSSQVPVYVTELAPRRIRGRLVAINQWSITWGALLMFVACTGFVKIESEASFRIAWGLQAIPALLLLVGTLFMDESPRWLASHGQWSEAAQILTAVLARGDPNDEAVLEELRTMQESLDAKKKFSWRALVMHPVNRRRLVTGLSAQMWKQLTGSTILTYYVVKIFAMAGYLGQERMMASSIEFAVNVVMTVPALLYIDRWGRRTMMLVGSAVCGCCMWMLVLLFAVYSRPLGPSGFHGDSSVRMYIPSSESAAQIGTITMVYIFVAVFACTWAPVAHVYSAEIFPDEQRAVAVALADATNWVFNVALSLAALPAFEAITWKMWCIPGSFLVIMFVHIFLCYPETKGRTLSEIELLFTSTPRKHARVEIYDAETDMSTVTVPGEAVTEKKDYRLLPVGPTGPV